MEQDLDAQYNTGNRRIDYLLQEILVNKKRVKFAKGKVELEDAEGKKETMMLDELAEREFSVLSKGLRWRDIVPAVAAIAGTLIVAGSVLYFGLGRATSAKQDWMIASDYTVRSKNSRILTETDEPFPIAVRESRWTKQEGNQDVLFPEETDHTIGIVYNHYKKGIDGFLFKSTDPEGKRYIVEKIDERYLPVELIGDFEVILADMLNLEDVNLAVSLGKFQKTYALRENDNLKIKEVPVTGENGKKHDEKRKVGKVAFTMPALEQHVEEIVIRAFDSEGTISVARVPVLSSSHYKTNPYYLREFAVDSDIELESNSEGFANRREPMHSSFRKDGRTLDINFKFESIIAPEDLEKTIGELAGRRGVVNLYIPELKYQRMMDARYPLPVVEKDKDGNNTDKIIGYEYSSFTTGGDLLLPADTPDGIYDMKISIGPDQREWNTFERQIGVYHDKKGIPFVFDPYDSRNLNYVAELDPAIQQLKPIHSISDIGETVVISGMSEGFENHFGCVLGATAHTFHVSRTRYEAATASKRIQNEVYDRSPRLESVDVRIDNKDEAITLNIGETKKYEIAGKSYNMTLMDRESRKDSAKDEKFKMKGGRPLPTILIQEIYQKKPAAPETKPERTYKPSETPAREVPVNPSKPEQPQKTKDTDNHERQLNPVFEGQVYDHIRPKQNHS